MSVCLCVCVVSSLSLRLLFAKPFGLAGLDASMYLRSRSVGAALVSCQDSLRFGTTGSNGNRPRGYAGPCLIDPLVGCAILAADLSPSPRTRYSVNRKVVEKVDMPFPKDAEDVPGRKKMKGRGVQRPPRPGGEEGEGEDERGVESEEEEGLL